MDNDCDVAVDEFVTQACGTNEGACVEGVETCSGGSFGDCVGETGPVLEICNNTDDDCDTLVDEFVTQACGTNEGACVEGEETCSGGSFGDCVGETGPVLETCDDVDNDCDTVVDENLGTPFGDSCDGSDADQCLEGVFVCVDATGDSDTQRCATMDSTTTVTRWWTRAAISQTTTHLARFPAGLLHPDQDYRSGFGHAIAATFTHQRLVRRVCSSSAKCEPVVDRNPWRLVIVGSSSTVQSAAPGDRRA